MPLEPDDYFFPDRVTYVYRVNSLYNRRFEQRQRLKELLGREYRPLVETAKRHTKVVFLQFLSKAQADAIRRILNIEPDEFWRACKGRLTLDLPPRLIQLELPFGDQDASVRTQAVSRAEGGGITGGLPRVTAAGA
jgi:hypothetical protein